MRQHARRFSIFASVGVLNTIIDFVSFLLLYEVVGLGVVPSNVAAFAIAVANSYVLNRTLTFADRSPGARLHSTGAKFIAVALVGLAVSTAIVYATSLVMHPFFGKPLASLASLFIGYAGASLVVFPQKKTWRPGRSASWQRALDSNPKPKNLSSTRRKLKYGLK